MDKKIIALIQNLPKESLPAVLTAVIRCCIKTNAFNGKKLSEIVASIEAAHKGQ